MPKEVISGLRIGTGLGMLLGIAWCGAAATARSEAVALRLEEQWSNVFGGRDVTFNAVAEAAGLPRAKLLVELTVEHRVLARREYDVSAGPDGTMRQAITVAVPPVDQGVVVEGLLRVAMVAGGGGPPAQVERALWIFAEGNPLSPQWVASRDLRVFDPEGRTTELFEAEEMPIRRLRDLGSLDQPGNAVVLIGEGVSLRSQRGLDRRLLQLAAGGARVLCLAPSGGRVVLTGAGDGVPESSRIVFENSGVIATLDKRLDSAYWPPHNRLPRASYTLRAERGLVVADFEGDDPAWCWLDLRYRDTGGRVIVCGVRIMEAWESSPAPRHLLWAILNELLEEKR